MIFCFEYNYKYECNSQYISISEGTRFLLRVINSFSKRAWVVPLKDKKDIIILNAFQKILDS